MELLDILKAAPYRILVFCDDLSFDHDDTAYKSLKAVLVIVIMEALLSEAEIRACVRLLGRLKTRLQPLADPLAAESRVPPRLVAAE